ncbi:hypothetical protein AB0J21_13245 [Streptomyces sp. NPDC049954]|uniref:hypothetical protein n=1 Tax=Streptomyces sp. NPDC049954 TaxID=3155779 RepID=UPI00343D4D2C
MSVRASVDLQQRVEELVRDFRGGDPLLPMFVLHAERPEDDHRADRILDDVHRVQLAHGARCAVLNPHDPQIPAEGAGDDDRVRAAALLRRIDSGREWEGTSGLGPQTAYRRYRFRRLRLVHALADAVRAVDAEEATRDGVSDPVQRRRDLLDQLAAQHWRPRRANRRDSVADRSRQAGAGMLAAVLAVLAAVLPLFEAPIALTVACGFLFLLAVLYLVPPGRTPMLLWLRRESRWFLTTTFLLPVAGQQAYEAGLLHPLRSWRAITHRAGDVADSLRAGGDAQLQLHVLALLEDLRDAHRRWSWDLRGFKRLRPPVLFLHRADAADGGIALLQAISDVRTVRSELDPLLVVASVAAQDVPALDRPRTTIRVAPRRTAPLNLSERVAHLHEEWEGALRARQSPSRSGTVPWALPIALTPTDLERPAQPVRWCERASARPAPARVLWSAGVLGVGLALVAGLLVAQQLHLDATYCRTGLLTADRDSVLLPGAGGEEQCIGISTGAVSFGARLPKDRRGPVAGGVPWSVPELEKQIGERNRKVLANSAGHYVTIVYAGPLSADATGSSSPVKGTEELAGLALAQAAVNEDNAPVKLRVLVANGGVDMDEQVRMARLIADYAQRDATVVGVVGAGRDMKTSGKVTEILGAAGLPVVSGTNSATYLPEKYANWFSLAAPDEWQAQQLGLLVRQLRTEGKPQRALVLSRETKGTGDMYTGEQEKYGGRMLQDRGFTLAPEKPIRYQLRDSGGAALRDAVSGFCVPGEVPDVIYFAGRVEDLGNLLRALSEDDDCHRHRIALVMGDDVSKAHFESEGIGRNVTIYHATLADLRDAAPGTEFYRDVERYLPGTSGRQAGYNSPFLASGQTALSHDATRALYEAASRKDRVHSRAATWVNLRDVELGAQATGTVNFKDAPVYGVRTGHAIALWRVRQDPGSGKTESVMLCGRTSGAAKELTVADCRIDKKR